MIHTELCPLLGERVFPQLKKTKPSALIQLAIGKSITTRFSLVNTHTVITNLRAYSVFSTFKTFGNESFGVLLPSPHSVFLFFVCFVQF